MDDIGTAIAAMSAAAAVMRMAAKAIIEADLTAVRQSAENLNAILYPQPAPAPSGLGVTVPDPVPPARF